ncbi:MAG TPA: archaetidylserine decarboxylase [Xanthobacteraceae bacterium]|nr:archaetidylserine decarboxylase [Xanthobacteraceae bacterium]
MTMRSQITRIFDQEDINFLLTNRIPRRFATQFIGWFSQIRQPRIRDASIAVWRMFSDLDLTEAKKQRFDSLHDCFTRELKDGARPIDPAVDVMTSPCDAIVGACGAIDGTVLYQAKGFSYTLEDLLGDSTLVATLRNGCFATLRLKSSMYHRFHAPYDGRIEQVTYIAGDTWNVNPIALKRIERLFCKNERAAVQMTLAPGGQTVALVAVAAILVASIRMHCLSDLLDGNYRGRNVIPCDSAVRKGDELGWFQHGSTIIVFAPEGFTLCDGVQEGAAIRMGQPLMRLP